MPPFPRGATSSSSSLHHLHRLHLHLHLHLHRLLRSFATSAVGSVWSFGDNSNGAVGGLPPLVDAYEPLRVPSLPSFAIASLAVGHYHSLAIAADGHLWSWGRNAESQLGRPSLRETWSIPQRVVGLDNVKVRAAAASGVVSAAIGDDGSLWVWGRSKRGQLGLGREITEATKPCRVEALAGHDVVKVSFGWGHAFALTKDGKIFGWGYSEDGRLGQMGQIFDATSKQPPDLDKHRDKSKSMLEIAEELVAERIEREDNMPIIWEPSLIRELSDINVSDVSCGLDHSLVLCCDGTLLSCGDNTYGQLGRTTEGSKLLPVETNFNFKPLSVSAGLGHSLLLCKTESEHENESN
ncbi:putative E3 ubiquitin-protein ligase HERC6, partial [Ananas comosus]